LEFRKMLVPPRGADHDVALCLNGGQNIRQYGVRHREVDAYIHIAQRLGTHFTPQFKYTGDGLALLARNRVDLPPHFAKADEYNPHVKSFRTSLSYRSMPSVNSRLLIFSAAVCASRIDPGPISSRFPVLVRCGASLPKETTVVGNPSTTCKIRGSDAP